MRGPGTCRAAPSWICSTGSWPSPSCWPSRTARGCGSGCWRPSGSTAAERLAEAGEEQALRWRHRDFYLGLARAQAAEWFGPRQEEGLARLRAEHANLRAALEASVADPAGPGAALAFVTALRCHWYADGYLAEGRTWLDHALSLPAGRLRRSRTACTPSGSRPGSGCCRATGPPC